MKWNEKVEWHRGAQSGRPGVRRSVQVLGYVSLVLGCSLLAGAAGAPVAVPQRVALTILGLGAAYWGVRFMRLARQVD